MQNCLKFVLVILAVTFITEKVCSAFQNAFMLALSA